MDQDLLLDLIAQNRDSIPVSLYFAKKSNRLEEMEEIKEYQYFSSYYQTTNHSFRMFLYKPYC
jgi:hypothetical protein